MPWNSGRGQQTRVEMEGEGESYTSASEAASDEVMEDEEVAISSTSLEHQVGPP
jgi:hypothetical protein